MTENLICNNLIYTESEQAVLGAILTEGELIEECNFSFEFFGIKEHQLIYQAMKILQEKRIAIDTTTVVTQLVEANQIEEIGGVSYLIDLANSVPTIVNFHFYVNKLIDSYRLRKAQSLATSLAFSPTEEKIMEVYNKLGNLQELSSTSLRTIQDVLVDNYENLLSPQHNTKVDTGFPDLDRLIGGFHDGDLIIIAARPSMGKTAFALNIALNHLKNGGIVDFFSLEMPEEQLLKRVLSAMMMINSKCFDNENQSVDIYEKIVHAIGAISEWTWTLTDKSGQTVSDIRSTLRQSKKRYPNQKHLIIIDYLQYIQQAQKFERHDLAIGDITRQLKNIAKEYHSPVILLSQLNRGVELRSDKRPMMSDIRDSGSVEQDADIIISLYRDDYYNMTTNSDSISIVELNVLKNRNGQTGKVEVAFQKEYGLFLSLRKNL